VYCGVGCPFGPSLSFRFQGEIAHRAVAPCRGRPRRDPNLTRGATQQSPVRVWSFSEMKKRHSKDEKGRLFQNHNFVPRPLDAGFFSRFFLTYLQDVIRSGGKRELTQDDVFALPEEEEAGYRHRLFAKEWKKQMELPADERSLFTVFKNLQRGPLLIAGLLYALGTTLAAGQPLLVKYFIVWLTAVHNANNPSNGSSTSAASSESIEYPGLNVPVSNDLWIGILILVLIPLVAFVIPIFQQNAVIRSLKVGMSLRSGMILAVYEKTLNLSSRAHQSEGAGNILTLMSNDAQKIMESFLWMMFGVFAPYQLVMITVALCIILGPYGLLPLGFTFVMFPPSMIISKRYMAIRMQMVGETVARTGLITEFFSAIRAIKYYAWEKPMLKKIDEHRESELNGLGKYLMNQAYLFALLYLSPVVATVGTLVIYRAGVGNLPLDIAFAAVAGIGLMRMPMVFLPIFFGIIAQNKVAMTRITNFLSLEELHDSPVQAALKKKNSKYSVVVRGATFSWSGVPLLNDLSFKLPKSSLTMVIGQVGSGKSTLISGLLGDAQLGKIS
jgi:ABC-type multidrug transport system fused ATPase/permease subunit